MIIFNKLVINNFLSWGENQEIPLQKQGVVLVEGQNHDELGANSNMAGKSSIIEAIIWGLFGRTIRSIRHDSVVNRFHRHNCFVTIYCHSGTVPYRISRYRNHHIHRNRLLLWREGKILSYRHEADTQAKLESILGCDYQSFAHTAIFGGPRSFALLTDAEQKKVLESFLHFEKFEIALRRAKDLLSETVEEKHELLLNIAGLRESVQEIRGRLGSLARAEKVGKRKLDIERTRIKQRLKKLSSTSKVDSLQGEVEEAGEAVEALVTSLAKAGARRKMLRQRLQLLKTSIRSREKLVGKPCPSCGQKVAGASVNAFLAHLSGDVRTARKQLLRVRERLVQIERRLIYARKRLKRVQKQQSDSLTYAILRRELKGRLKKLEVGESTPFVREIQCLSLQYSRKVSRLLLLEFEKKTLEQRIKDLEFWVTGFGNQGVKALIVREALPAMNKKLSEYAQEIYHGTVQMKFSPSKENKKGEERELFHLQYKSKYGAASYIGESTGGRKRVDICVLLVFSWLSSTCNVLFCDELLDGLDESGREAVLNILSKLRGTVLVITHEKGLKAKFEKVWVVEKRNGISKLEKAA
jgi:Herelleviridae exonuclease